MTDYHVKGQKSKIKPKADALKRGWTTGACATAATKAALTALFSGEFVDPISIKLPKGETPSFPLALEGLGVDDIGEFSQAAIVKDAGDDPDVTHGALIIAEVRKIAPSLGVQFIAGDGVGTVTLEGLPIAVGQAAINPIPRQLMTQVVKDVCTEYGVETGVQIKISIPNGQEIAKKTWNPRLGIMGGLSILGTTGIVHPFSCSAWIASIHRGVDVALAAGHKHVAGSTGSTSEAAVKKFHNLDDIALMDMGDFVGGLLKYIRNNPIERVTVAGGFAKISKLAMGFRDLHSSRSQVDFNWMAEQFILLNASNSVCDAIKKANTAMQCLNIATENNVPIAHHIGKLALKEAIKIVNREQVNIDILICNRAGDIVCNIGKL